MFQTSSLESFGDTVIVFHTGQSGLGWKTTEKGEGRAAFEEAGVCENKGEKSQWIDSQLVQVISQKECMYAAAERETHLTHLPAMGSVL